MQRSSLFWLYSDWLTAIQRSLRHIFRNIDSLITAMILPVSILILFVLVFGGAVQTGTEYVNYIVPGVILTCVAYGSSTTAMIVNRDMTGGLFNRFRTLPIAQSSILVGHVTSSLVRNSMSAILVFGVALLLGFRPTATPTEWLAVAGILALVILVVSWLAVGFGIIAKSVDSTVVISFAIMLLPYLSSAFVPVSTLPSWLQGFAEYQPSTPIIETLRSLLIGTPTDKAPLAIAWCVGLLIVFMSASLLLYRIKAKR